MTYPEFPLVFGFPQISRLLARNYQKKTIENGQIRFWCFSLKKDVVKSEEVQRMGSGRWSDQAQYATAFARRNAHKISSICQKKIVPFLHQMTEFWNIPNGLEGMNREQLTAFSSQSRAGDH